MTNKSLGILACVQLYLDGLHHGSLDHLSRAFADSAQLWSNTDPEPKAISKRVYLEIVSNRDSPQQRGAIRADNVHKIEQVSPTSAIAVVSNSNGERQFSDVLVLALFDEEEWKIVAKVWHYTVL